MADIMHIVGNRPQFIKLSPVVCELRKRGYKNIIIHTGQHFDNNMSDVFFDELGIPDPEENLHVSGGSHAIMTSNLICAIEPVVDKYAPDIIVVYGDTNSTLAAAVTAKKMGKRIVHVESGVRSGVEFNPEEINRHIVDHISDLLFAPDKVSYSNLVRENLEDRSCLVGDTMYDTYLRCLEIVEENDRYTVGGLPRHFVLMTWHRQENTSDKANMMRILDAVRKVGIPVVCPLHPRTVNMLKDFDLWEMAESISNFRIIEPLGYLEMVYVLNRSEWVLTDSGGLSKESYFAGKLCVYMSDLVIWPDLERDKWIIHLGSEVEKTYDLVRKLISQKHYNGEKYYGDGSAAIKIADEIEQRFLKGN